MDHHVIALFALISMGLDLLGGLFLAHDLFGRRQADSASGSTLLLHFRRRLFHRAGLAVLPRGRHWARINLHLRTR
jgi:hypothetical protein